MPDAAAIKSEGASEDGIALDFLHQHGRTWRYVEEWGIWVEFDGHLWQRRSVPQLWTRLSPIVRAHAATLDGLADRRRLLKRATHSGAEGLARGPLTVHTDIFDADPWLLNTPGGIVDLKTGTLRPARPEDYCSQATLVTPTPKIECPSWIKFMDAIMDGDAELVAFLQRLTGLSLIGKVIEHVVPFLYGTGGNGKGVFLETIGTVLHDYAQAAPMTLFTETKGTNHPTEMARLQGKRFLRAQETGSGAVWDDTLVKALTGGDRIPARFMRQDFFEFDPKFTVFIAGNHKPHLRRVTGGERRRFKMIPFNVDFAKRGEVDPELRTKLLFEAPGILRWMIEGCRQYQQIGLAPPKAVLDTTDEYFAEQDPLSSWRAARLQEGDPGTWTSEVELYADYSKFPREHGDILLSKHEFGTRMENAGFRALKRKPGKGYLGAKLRPTVVEVKKVVGLEDDDEIPF
jgi:putative DNA primase/helicase